jgi:16S rRNA (cytidine1402-2'-O)-methyltransferase
VAGVLYIVATPIGNLDDLSYRAAKTLGAVDVVACEDTRQTAKLLDAAEVRKPMVSLHEHNERERTAELIQRLQSGDSVALVSDAGTPLISDPGYRLVSAAVAAGIRVIPIPGPSAILALLSVCGLATDAFVFIGFLPHKRLARRDTLAHWGKLEATLVFFESPHRILDALDDLAEVLPGRKLAVGRELTKVYEEVLRGSADEVKNSLLSRDVVKGEFVVAVERALDQPDPEHIDLAAEVDRLIATGLSRMDAIKAAAKSTGRGKREVYDELERRKQEK